MLRRIGLALLCVTFSASMAAAQSRSLAGVQRSVPNQSSRTDGATWLREAGRHLSHVAAAVNPAVVHIECDHEGRGGELIEETGSGVIMQSPRAKRPFVVTNRHVVVGAPMREINIHLADGRILHPASVLDDMSTDLAVLMLRETDVTAARWGDSDNLDIGHVVLAMGSPFGLSQSVTSGIVSAKGRSRVGLTAYENFIQTDAAINPGNSGGPLIDLGGHVVGINTAIASQGGGNEGIGFSIPSNLVRFVVEELIDKGRVQRGYLGVKLDNAFDLTAASRLKLKRVRGARVVHVYDETPASMAGLRVDDVILNFDGIDIEDESHLIHRVSLTPVNKRVRVVVMREGREVPIQVTLTERPGDPRAQRNYRPDSLYQPSGYQRSRDGLRVQRLDRPISMQLGYRGETGGVLVTRLSPETAAAGLRLYDVIEEVARQPVSTVAEFVEAAGALNEGSSVVLKVRRAEEDGVVQELIVVDGLR